MVRKAEELLHAVYSEEIILRNLVDTRKVPYLIATHTNPLLPFRDMVDLSAGYILIAREVPFLSLAPIAGLLLKVSGTHQSIGRSSVKSYSQSHLVAEAVLIHVDSPGVGS